MFRLRQMLMISTRPTAIYAPFCRGKWPKVFAGHLPSPKNPVKTGGAVLTPIWPHFDPSLAYPGGSRWLVGAALWQGDLKGTDRNMKRDRSLTWEPGVLEPPDASHPSQAEWDAARLAALLRLRARRLGGSMAEVQHRTMREAAPSIRRPLLSPTEEGAYQLVWSYRDRPAALEIEVGVDGWVQWLFIDRASGSCEGTEKPESHLPERALSFAQRVA